MRDAEECRQDQGHLARGAHGDGQGQVKLVVCGHRQGDVELEDVANGGHQSEADEGRIQLKLFRVGVQAHGLVDVPACEGGEGQLFFFFFYGRIPHTLETRGDKLLQLRNGTHIRAKKRPLRHMCTLMDETYSL